MSGRLSAILDNLERVSQDPACPLEEMQLLVKEADRECIVNPEEGSVISHFLNEMKAIISSRGDQVADKFEADRAKTGVFLCRLPTFVSPPVVDDTMNLNCLCVCMYITLLAGRYLEDRVSDFNHIQYTNALYVDLPHIFCGTLDLLIFKKWVVQ